MAWPLAQVIIYIIRFGMTALQENVLSSPLALLIDSLTFSMVGLLSGLLLFAFIRRGRLGRNIAVIVGYVLVTPIALLFAVAGGLLFPIIGPIMLGWSILAVGITLAYGLMRLYEFGIRRWQVFAAKNV